LKFIRNHEFNSKTFICHVRKDKQAEVTLRNTHPFVCEMSAKMNVFAHNGKLVAFDQEQKLTGRFQPVGESDSEFSFCCLLEILAPFWQSVIVPDLYKRMDVISKFVKKIRSNGPANFIYAAEDALFVHAHERIYADGKIAPPELFKLCHLCQSEKALAVSKSELQKFHNKIQQVSLLVSVPLSGEEWSSLKSVELLVIRNGRVIME
jgi:predicted glutamine amidotransferase